MIEIKCTGSDSLPLDAITEFQGNLKKRTKKDIEKIITSIQKYGFSFPFFIWNGSGDNYCLDGHGRIQALAEMRRRGIDLPLFPVVYIEAEDEAEAKQKLLRLNSQYGQMSIDSVLEFAGDISIEFEELQLPSGGILSLGDRLEAVNTEPAEIEEADISDAVMTHRKIYISYSGGRDSTLALAKTLPVFLKEGKDVEVLFVDTGAEFPDLVPYIIRVVGSYGVPIKILRAERTFFDVYLNKGKWPCPVYRDCITALINDPIDRYCSRDGEKYVLVRGARKKQKTSRSKSNVLQYIKGDDLKTIYNPIFDLTDAQYDEEIKQLPLWRGYSLGFDRTACWCCPFQTAKQWDALKEHYPLLWQELKVMFGRLTFKELVGDGYIKRVRKYWPEVKTC